VGEDRQDAAGSPPAERVSVPQAADHLGTTVDALRKRVQRGTIPYERDRDGRVWILLDTGRPRQDTDRPQSEPDALISEMRERLAFLEHELEVRSEEIRRRDTIIMNMTEAMKALNPPASEASSEARESSETVEKEPERAEPRSATEGTQEGARRPWWRRMFGG
jgi:hypothetical protein